MRKKGKRFIFRKVLRFESRNSRYEQKMNPAFEHELKEWKKLKAGMGAVQFTFREGFPERVTARLLNILEKDPMREFYYNLSSLFPKIAYSSLALLVLITVTILVVHGQLDQNILLGTDKVDDTNFISYLIFQTN